MQKIITALDGYHLSQSAIDYSVFMARHCSAHLVGVFLDDVLYHNYQFADMIDEKGAISDKLIRELNTDDAVTRGVAAAAFEKACRHAGIEHTIHHDRNVALQELLQESVYADLLIIDSKESFLRHEKEAPTDFFSDLLSDVQCPVMVVPQKFSAVEKLVILYDGKPSSVHAIKMFSYLFPDIKYLDTEVLSVKEEDQTLHVPDNHLMKEFMKRHFPDADYTVQKGSPEETITAYLQKLNRNALVVLGAYQRSRVSRWFRPSMADHLLEHLKLPLFIAHNK